MTGTTNQKPETRNCIPAPLGLLDLCESRFRAGLALGLSAEPWLNDDADFPTDIRQEAADARNYFLFWKKQIYRTNNPSAAARAVLDILQALEHLRKAFDLVTKIEEGLKGGE
jgi:hypothetical protein